MRHHNVMLLTNAIKVVVVTLVISLCIPHIGYSQEQDIDILIRDLKDFDSRYRSSAAQSLGEIKDPRAVELLIDALQDEDAYVRASAAQSLGKIKDPRAVEPLIAALQDEDSYVRGWAAQALGEINTPRAIEALNTFR